MSPSPFNNLLYQNVQPSTESRSEVSTNESEWSDINSIAQQMGVTVAELQVDRFKVDRSKLESMVKGRRAFQYSPSQEKKKCQIYYRLLKLH